VSDIPSEDEFRQGIVYATMTASELGATSICRRVPAVSAHRQWCMRLWRRGHGRLIQYWGAVLRARYAGFTISYRLTKPGRKNLSEAVHDVRAAVQFHRAAAPRNWARSRALRAVGQFGRAPSSPPWWRRGHAPLFAGAYRQDPHAGVSTGVKVLIGVYGIYDLVAQWRHSQIGNPGDNLVESYLGASPMQDRRLYFDASRSAMRSSATTRPRSI